MLFLILGTSPRKGWVTNPVLRFFGYISYGMYLIHFLVFRLYDLLVDRFWPGLKPTAEHFRLVCVRFVIVGAASTGLAYLSRKYYEERFLRLKDRFSQGLREAKTDRKQGKCVGYDVRASSVQNSGIFTGFWEAGRG